MRELSQLERQRCLAARIRKEIAQADFRSHETQVQHVRYIGELRRTTFTNEGLYSYLQGNLRKVYFQCYQAAYEIAMRGAMLAVLGRGADVSSIKYGAWVS